MAEIVEFEITGYKSNFFPGRNGELLEKITLTDAFDTEYVVFANKLESTPFIGDIVKAVIQKVNNKYGKYNSITSLLFLNKKEKPIAQSKEVKIMSSKYHLVEGKLFYAHIKEKDTKGKFPTNKYKAEIAVNAATAKDLEKLGVLIKNKNDERGQFFTVKSDYQPIVIGTDGNILTDIPLIGNGSEALVTINLYKNKAPQGGEYCAGFNKVQLKTLIQYEPTLLGQKEETKHVKKGK